MDPFSTAASALSVADICLRVGKYIKNYVKDVVGIDETVASLQSDIDGLEKVCKAIHGVYMHAEPRGDGLLSPPDTPFQVQTLSHRGSLASLSEGTPAVGSRRRSASTRDPPSSVVDLNNLIKSDLRNCQKLVEETQAMLEDIVNQTKESPDEGEQIGDSSTAIAIAGPSSSRNKGNNIVSRGVQRTKNSLSKMNDKHDKHSAYGKVEHKIKDKKDQISTYKQEMVIMLQILTYFYVMGVDERTTEFFETVDHKIHNLVKQIDQKMQEVFVRVRLQPGEEREQNWERKYLESLKTIKDSIGLGLATIKQESSNTFFDIPQAVSPNYIGRVELLKKLREELLPSSKYTPDSGQRVFVVHGLGGSGKTQFCCKFAQDNRFRLWGVFWVNASTERRLKRTLIDIFIRYGGGSPDNADVGRARDWLAGLGQPWLLIIDNADHPNLNIDQYLPRSEKGCVLITTKSKNHINLGTVGERFESFSGLEKDDATELLLVSSFTKRDKWQEVKSKAEHIVHELGYLALAIVHAGAAIHKELCTFSKYIDYFKVTCKQITEQHRTSLGHNGEFYRAFHLSRSHDPHIDDVHSDDGDFDGDIDTERDMPVFATWEICYQRLAKQAAKNMQAPSDAVQLLGIFAFLDCRLFSMETLTRAVTNADLEQKEAAANRAKKGGPRRAENQGYFAYWLRRVGASMAKAFVEHVSQGGAKLVPAVVSECRSVSKSMAELRIRAALNELSQMSLIGSYQGQDKYFMHPVVHTWARERLPIAQQALLADMTGYLLSASILLPPLGSSKTDDDYHFSILAHVEYVSQHKAYIQKRIANERAKHQRRAGAMVDFLYNLVQLPDAEAILLHAKFGLVYAKSGMLEKARDRFVFVQEQLYKYQGKECEEARTVDQALSNIYFALGDGPKARALLEDVLDCCERTLGKDHEDTYRVQGQLGRTLWMMGFITEACRQQRAAVKGLEATIGRDARDTLEIVDQLGSTVSKFWTPEDLLEAYGLHKRVVDTLSQRTGYGEDHELVLFATENLCRVAILIRRRRGSDSSGGDSDASATPELAADPFATADIGLGSFNSEADGGGLAARARAAKIRPEPAESVVAKMKCVLDVRERDLGEKHPFTLLAMVNYAITLAAVHRFEDAERILRKGLSLAYGILPEKHIGILFGRQTLACVLREQGQYREAGAILRQVYKFQAEIDNKSGFHPDRLATLFELSHCYLLVGDIDASIREIMSALEGFKWLTDERHPIMIQTRQTHEQLLEVKRCRAKGLPEPPVTFPRYLYES